MRLNTAVSMVPRGTARTPQQLREELRTALLAVFPALIARAPSPYRTPGGAGMRAALVASFVPASLKYTQLRSRYAEVLTVSSQAMELCRELDVALAAQGLISDNGALPVREGPTPLVEVATLPSPPPPTPISSK